MLSLECIHCKPEFLNSGLQCPSGCFMNRIPPYSHLLHTHKLCNTQKGVFLSQLVWYHHKYDAIKNGSTIHDLQVLDKVDMPLCERPKKPDHCPMDIYNILTSCCWAHEPHQRARFSVLQSMCKEVGSLWNKIKKKRGDILTHLSCAFKVCILDFLAQHNNKTFIKIGNQDKRNLYLNAISRSLN